MPGKSAFEMLDRMGADGGVRALMVLASNIVVSAPDVNRIKDRLESLDFLLVSDIFLSETAAMADVVLPTAQWAEEEGTMTNLEGRVLHRIRALPPPDGVLTDLELLAELAERLGRGRYFSSDPREVFDELRRASAGGIADYAGITWERIDAEKGVFWPCPDVDHPGTPRLFAETFPTASGRAAFLPVDYRPANEQTDLRYPYLLTTGRLAAQYQSGTQTRRVRTLSHADPGVTMHPNLARTLNVAGGDLVELETRRGRATFRAVVDDTIRADTLFIPFHWGGVSSANLLTDPALDPHSRMPAFKVCAASATRVGGVDDDHLLTAPALRPLHAAARPADQTGVGPTSPAPAAHRRPHSERTSPWPPRTVSCRASTPSPDRAWTSPPRWAPTWSGWCRTASSPRRCTSAAGTPPTSW